MPDIAANRHHRVGIGSAMTFDEDQAAALAWHRAVRANRLDGRSPFGDEPTSRRPNHGGAGSTEGRYGEGPASNASPRRLSQTAGPRAMPDVIGSPSRSPRDPSGCREQRSPDDRALLEPSWPRLAMAGVARGVRFSSSRGVVTARSGARPRSVGRLRNSPSTLPSRNASPDRQYRDYVETKSSDLVDCSRRGVSAGVVGRRD